VNKRNTNLTPAGL